MSVDVFDQSVDQHFLNYVNHFVRRRLIFGVWLYLVLKIV